MLWWLQLLGGYEARGDARASRVTAPHPLHQGLSVPHVHLDHHSVAHDDIGREYGQNPGEVIVRRYCTPWISVGKGIIRRDVQFGLLHTYTLPVYLSGCVCIRGDWRT